MPVASLVTCRDPGSPGLRRACSTSTRWEMAPFPKAWNWPPAPPAFLSEANQETNPSAGSHPALRPGHSWLSSSPLSERGRSRVKPLGRRCPSSGGPRKAGPSQSPFGRGFILTQAAAI